MNRIPRVSKIIIQDRIEVPTLMHSLIHLRIYIASLQENHSEVLPSPAPCKETAVFIISLHTFRIRLFVEAVVTYFTNNRKYFRYM